MCEGNKLLGDYCDEDDECLSEMCDTNENKCISFDQHSTDKVEKSFD